MDFVIPPALLKKWLDINQSDFFINIYLRLQLIKNFLKYYYPRPMIKTPKGINQKSYRLRLNL